MAAAGLTLFILAVPVLLVWSADTQLPSGPGRDNCPKIKMLVSATGKVRQIPLETYLLGVLAAEMPAEFVEAALRAQALAARTYAVKRMIVYGAAPNPGHPEAEVCDNPVHCQAWISAGEMESRWGKFKYSYYYYKIRRAAAATVGQILTCGGKLIDPVYHSSCGGRGTVDAADVWGQDVPYLRGVECKWEEDNPKNRAEQKMALTEVLRRLALAPAVPKAPDVSRTIPATTAGQPALSVLSQTAAGRLIEVRAGNRVLSGKDFRTALGLDSALVSWQIAGDTVYLKTLGKGHGVGLCQYGANGMAKAGKNYQEILMHYYTGVVIKRL